MRPEPGVHGVFADPEQAARAVRELRRAGHPDVRALLPAPFPAVIAALDRPRSALDQVTLGGTVFGVVAGFVLCWLTSAAWPLVTGAKPIVSVPSFVVVAFELALLVGAMTIVVALLVAGFVGGRRRPVPDVLPRSSDQITVFVPRGDARVETILLDHGATEVRRAE